jgi:hypothetical protein
MKLRAAAVFAILLGCDNSNILTFEGGSDAPSDALTCGPVMLPEEYVAPAMHPPNPAHQNMCSTDAISDYITCDIGQDTTKCSEFMSGQEFAACGTCIESQSTAATWGVIVFDSTSMTGTVNIGGCVDDALGQVAAEPASCGSLVYASYSCQNATCGSCMAQGSTGNDFGDCELLALAGQCAPYDALVESSMGPCASLQTDVVTGDVANCFPSAGIMDPTMQEEAWLTSIITFMCGP